MYGAGHKRPAVVLLGSSFGGLDALKAVLPALPPAFPVPVIVVHHRAESPDALVRILRARCQLPVEGIESGYRLTAGRIAVAPPGSFSRISSTGEVTVDGPERGAPALGPIDRAARAVAKRFGAGAVAVILTGRQADGAEGVRAVKGAGGFVLIQDPAGAAAAGMPIAALATGCVDHRVPLRLIAPTLVAVTMAPGALELLRVPAPPWATASTAG
jgi:two-component system chemotaxis response regulator CheB